jgi:histidyl-tRNA synthetase
MTEKIKAVKGMNDLLPQDSHRWAWLEARVMDLMHRYQYLNIRTPIVEHSALFVRGLGEVTDIVEKEMYSFEDRLNKEHLTLRPEATAGVVRSVVENNLLYDGPRRMFYMGPMFRHERPQRGRYRQFHQIGAEALGFGGPEIDAELILMAHELWRILGLQDVSLELNSLGQPKERAAHRLALIEYLKQHEGVLDEDAKRRLHSNPLRILDTKNPAMQDMVNGAPKLIDFLSPQSMAHLNEVKRILDENHVAYRVNPRLVRGMDYYNLTVFEFVTHRLGSQGTICGGGRYDHLIEQLGGKSAPAVGWALGVERVLELLSEEGLGSDRPVPDVYAVVPDYEHMPLVFKTLQSLRALGLSVQMHAPATPSLHTFEESASEQSLKPWAQLGSMKSQFKKADACGAAYALVFGSEELSRGEVSVKSLRDGVGAQKFESLENLEQWAKALQSHR